MEVISAITVEELMRISAFIRSNTSRIVAEWEDFARALIPAAEGMTPLALRNHIANMLVFITDDMDSLQTAAEKSHGGKVKQFGQSAAEVHASLRQAGGFNLDQMVSECRSLRASVIKLWATQSTAQDGEIAADLIRFNESIDQILTESISYYASTSEVSRDLFVGILGHDFRNPLSAVLMSAQLGPKMGPLNENQTKLLSQVIMSARRAIEIVDTLLDLTRARLGSGFPVIKEPMDFGDVGKQLVDEMGATHPDRKITFEASGYTRGVWDKPRIGQVLSNLLSNALQYGASDRSVDVTVAGRPHELVLSVHNEGNPIPDTLLGRIFSSYQSNNEIDMLDRHNSKNLGLGLYITKEIVIAHGGTISVTSSRSAGTTFTARFPRTMKAE
jgi:signal transduction histidine kinase